MRRRCKRCRSHQAERQTRTAVALDLEQIVEHVWLCEQCRFDARVENATAIERRTIGWEEAPSDLG